MQQGRLVIVIAFSIYISCFGRHSWAQDKNGIIDDHNKKSSSFVVDPDPLDPLPVKKENIKDGDEIILDDIRQVIDSKPKSAAGNEVSVPTGQKNISKIKKNKSSLKKMTVKKTKSVKNRKRSESIDTQNRVNDESDAQIENRLSGAYGQSSLAPTSSEQWGMASKNQKQNIYIVQKNDTLFTISKTLFGDSKFWPKVWALNRTSILNPHYIYPGMKIYFYAGDINNSPTISTGSVNTVNDMNQGLSPDDKYFSQNTEFQKTNSSETNSKYTDPTVIPDSLPLVKNSKYYSNEQSNTEIDLQNFEYTLIPNYLNPYVLSSVDLKSDFIVPKDQISNLICKENQFVPLLIKKNIDATPGAFLIVEKLAESTKRLKSTFKYKKIGTVTVNEKNQMRVSDCKQLMSVDSLIVSDDKLKSLTEPSEEFDFSASIVDGLDYHSQDYYTENQYLIINLQGLNVDDGANLNIVSDELGKKVGSIQVLRRTGTMAIAVVTHVYDIINRGDKITE
jgi:hypothetical protein